MSVTVFNESEIRKTFDSISPKYKLFGNNLRNSIKFLLKKEKIDFHKIEFRLKEFKSFLNKIERKTYFKDPFNLIEDICGLRIICFYYSDIEKIANLIKTEFDIIRSEDKIATLEPDKFGYSSWHFIIKIKKEWAVTPEYRKLTELKAEIQIRTILMHAWADIEHKLSYEDKNHVPKKNKRRFSRLNAILELADEQFDYIREEKEDYLKSFSNLESYTNQELNLDSLQSLLDFFFPNREKGIRTTINLLDDLNLLEISMNDLLYCLEKSRAYWENIEEELGKELMKEDAKFFGFRQIGAMRVALMLFNDVFWNYEKNFLKNKVYLFPTLFKILDKWRLRLKVKT